MIPARSNEASSEKPVTAYIGLGSNLQQPIQQIKQALQRLGEIPQTRLIVCSPLYRSAPLGPADQPDYINAVAALATRLSPLALLDALQAIERQQGRVREGERWGPRTLDLDLLLYGEQQIHNERLTVPHPGLGERNFVLYPLYDVAGEDLLIPGLDTLGHLLHACPRQGLELLETC
ncbi:MAG: 2-amino-4-hydroxy-6-hydroxymethyldihydropteridine diphosphokinase [Gammaproteobacteria bacterium]|nr:2-amino-4-hydroxy-6-hydroxymethyldihydropteridine diphosphokinase [Gammaproteobacteria bacterium]